MTAYYGKIYILVKDPIERKQYDDCIMAEGRKQGKDPIIFLNNNAFACAIDTFRGPIEPLADTMAYNKLRKNLKDRQIDFIAYKDFDGSELIELTEENLPSYKSIKIMGKVSSIIASIAPVVLAYWIYTIKFC
jgi:hypothetical protein